MEDLGAPIDEVHDPDEARRAELRRALGFPASGEPDREPRVHRGRRTRTAPVAEQAGAASTEVDLADSPDQRSFAGSVEETPPWRADLNQLYAAMSERLKIHSEEVTRNLTEERERLAGLLGTMIEQLGGLGWTPPAGGELPPELRNLESQLLVKVDELTDRLAEERDGLAHVVSAIEQELRDIRSTQPVAATAPNPQPEGSLALLKAQVSEIHIMLSDHSFALRRGDEDPHVLSDVLSRQIAEIRAQLAEERTGRDAWLQSVAYRLAARLTELNGPPDAMKQEDSAMVGEVRALARNVAALLSPESGNVSLDVVADDLDTMRKELDERLSGIEAAVAEIRSSLRTT